MTDKTNIKFWKLAGAIVETILGIPFFGGVMILLSAWSLLGLALILHIIVLVFSVNCNKRKAAPILGSITSMIGWIPIVGMIMHIVTAILYWIEWAQE